jgi:hypothetical protein
MTMIAAIFIIAFTVVNISVCYCISKIGDNANWVIFKNIDNLSLMTL